MRLFKKLSGLPTKEFLFAVFFVWFTLCSINILYTYNAVTNLDFGDPTKVMITNFEIDTKGEPHVGDTCEFKIGISSVSSKTEDVQLRIIRNVEKEQEVVYREIVSIYPFRNKNLTCQITLKEAGSHRYVLYYKVDSEEEIGGTAELNGMVRVEKTVEIVVKSYNSPEYEQSEFVVTYFHYNPQFRCGDFECEERILNGSIRFLLEFYEKHPNYRFSFEIQGYGIEKLAKSYPDVFEIFKKLYFRGQMELIVTHYSDQLFIAYPETDMRKSIEISREILANYNMRSSNVFGCQEWQWSEALVDIMKDYNYDIFASRQSSFRKYYEIGDEEVGIWERNADDGSVYLILDKRVKMEGNSEESTLVYDWGYHGDGERVNTECNINDFVFLEEKQQEFEDKLARWERDGRQFLTISQLVYSSLEKELPIRQIDEVPCSSQGRNYLWLGEEPSAHERDVEILTKRYRARTSLLTLESVIKYAEKLGIENLEEEKETVFELWKELLLAEVSDSTGWKPRPCEVKYSLDKSEIVLNNSTLLVNQILRDLGVEEDVIIDTMNEEILNDTILPSGKESDLPIEVNVSFENYSREVLKYSDNLYRVVIQLEHNEIVVNNISFDVLDEEIAYSPMSSGEILELYKFKDLSCGLALSNGWIYLGQNASIINVQTTRYTATILNNDTVYFKEDNVRPEAVYEFFIYIGSRHEALDFAQRFNVQPCVHSGDITRQIYYLDR